MKKPIRHYEGWQAHEEEVIGFLKDQKLYRLAPIMLGRTYQGIQTHFYKTRRGQFRLKPTTIADLERARFQLKDHFGQKVDDYFDKKLKELDNAD